MAKQITFIRLLLLMIALFSMGFGSAFIYLSQSHKPVAKETMHTPHITPADGREAITVTLPSKYVTFSIPRGFTSSLHDDHSYISNDVKLEAGNNAQTKGIQVTYSVTSPWTPNIYNIPFAKAFNGTGKTTQLDSAPLLSDGASVTPDQVTMYTYLQGDAEGHNRGKLGSAHQGDVRLDIETPDHIVSSEAILFQCLDDTTQSAISQRCDKIMRLFLTSLKVKGARMLASPPDWNTPDYFAALSFKKRNFIYDERVALFGFASSLKDRLSYPYFSQTQDAEIYTTDNSLRVLRCMPQQLYADQPGYPKYSDMHPEKTYYSIRTTDGNNLFHEVDIQDPRLLELAHHIQEYAKQQGRVMTQFIACQTDEGKYIVKYNGKKIALQAANDPSVYFVNEDVIDAEVGIMTADGHMERTVSIPLPKTQIYCEKPLELTSNNIFYFGCNVREENKIGTRYGQNIYRVDLNNFSYKLLSQCRVDYTNNVGETTNAFISQPSCR